MRFYLISYLILILGIQGQIFASTEEIISINGEEYTPNILELFSKKVEADYSLRKHYCPPTSDNYILDQLLRIVLQSNAYEKKMHENHKTETLDIQNKIDLIKNSHKETTDHRIRKTQKQQLRQHQHLLHKNILRYNTEVEDLKTYRRSIWRPEFLFPKTTQDIENDLNRRTELQSWYRKSLKRKITESQILETYDDMLKRRHPYIVDACMIKIKNWSFYPTDETKIEKIFSIIHNNAPYEEVLNAIHSSGPITPSGEAYWLRPEQVNERDIDLSAVESGLTLSPRKQNNDIYSVTHVVEKKCYEIIELDQETVNRQKTARAYISDKILESLIESDTRKLFAQSNIRIGSAVYSYTNKFESCPDQRAHCAPTDTSKPYEELTLDEISRKFLTSCIP